ncbi:FAD-dependent oxidoreductase [Pseudomonas sp. IT-P218]|uniref:FAD-dependent oxidoreductase n=1 Tax=Pseudomonas sp. IT-P218 TaxID=3026449 RepID=UPI0039E1C121
MTNSKARKVLIVGGGIGGLTAAIALRQVGIEVDLVELKAEWSVYGVGIIQQGNVVREMARLGIADQCLSHGYSFDQVRICNAQGHPLTVIPGKRLAGDAFPANMALPRIDLHNILLDKASRLGAQIELGVTVESFEQKSDSVSVCLTTGRVGDYDLLIGADGIYSKIRALLLGDQFKPAFTGQGGWRCNMPRFPEIDCLTVFRGERGGQAGFCPLKDNLMYMLQTTAEPGNPWFDPNELHTLFKERLAEFEGPIGRARDEFLTDPAQVIYKPFETIFMEQWHAGRVLLIGDAVHATTPHLGQGAGMAIEDAVVIAEELQAHPVDKALEHFMTRRFERCKFIVETSRQIGVWEMDRSLPADFDGAVRRMLEVTAQPI